MVVSDNAEIMDGAVASGAEDAVVRPLSALVVDDSPTGRRIMQALLTVQGFAVVQADGPAQALEAIAQHQFGLITVDRILGDFDGVDLVCELRHHPYCGDEPRILAVTGNVGKAHSDAFFAAGADAFLNKPFTVNDLAEMLGALGFNALT